MFCRETVADLRRLAEAGPTSPEILFFHSGNREEGERFFNDFWPEARAVSDESHFFYDAFALKGGSLREIFGPGVWFKAVKTARKGHFPARPVGNPWLMPGIFLVRNGEVLWSWKYRNIGDNPDLSSIQAVLQQGAGS